MPNLSRRRILIAPAALMLGSAVTTVAGQEPLPKETKTKTPPKVRPMKPPVASDLVKQFVLEAHRNLDEVKKLYAQEPALLNACWDWGGGDFETALGGASHTGQREIALFLLEKGARLDLFAAAALGYLDVVKATVAANPGCANAPGPHGIPLIVHAKMGKEPAKLVLEYLESLMKKE